jgi:hypothetical protein
MRRGKRCYTLGKFRTRIHNISNRFGHSLQQQQGYRLKRSVADPGCLSRIPDPDFYPSRIQKQYQKREMKKKFVIILFSVVTNFTKLNIMLFLKC